MPHVQPVNIIIAARKLLITVCAEISITKYNATKIHFKLAMLPAST